MSIDSIYARSDAAIVSELWHRVDRVRLEQNISQVEMANAIGVDARTYRRAITGAGRLEALVAVLRVLGKLELIDNFIPQQTSFSPLELVKLKGKERQRASKKKGKASAATNQTEELDW